MKILLIQLNFPCAHGNTIKCSHYIDKVACFNFEILLAFFQEFFSGGGKIYCYANFICYANFSIIFGSNFRRAIKLSDTSIDQYGTAMLKGNRVVASQFSHAIVNLSTSFAQNPSNSGPNDLKSGRKLQTNILRATIWNKLHLIYIITNYKIT